MDSDVQQNISSTQPLPIIPTSPSKNLLKILLFILLELAVIGGSVFIGVLIGKNQIAKIQPITEEMTPTPSIDANLAQKCSTDKDCPNNSFCDYSMPGGMGPNGFVSGQPYGSQKCILKCQSNDECLSKQCQEFEIVVGDISSAQKGCKLQ